jgi:hypothetical protein
MFEDFEGVDFPPGKGSIPEGLGGFVYVFCWISGAVEVPFYVGETGGLSKRMKNYCAASFSCVPDFRVGECIRYLKETKQYRVIFRYRSSSDGKKERKREEDDIKEGLLLSGRLLLNYFRGHSHHVDKEIVERERLHKFCDASIALQNLRPPIET